MRQFWPRLLLAGLLYVPTAALAETSLPQLQTTYAQSLADAQNEAAQARQAWPDRYTAKLEEVLKQLQQAGDLDGVLAVRKELDRFKQEGSIPDSSPADTLATVRSLQAVARAAAGRVETDAARKIVTLTGQYIKALEKLQATLTTKGSLEDALSVREEIQRVKSDAAVTAAQFALSDAESRQPKAAPAEAGPADTQAAKPEGEARPDVARLKRIPEALREGVALYYPFDTDERLTVTDASGHKHAGRLSGVKWTAKSGVEGGVTFDGRTDAITIPDSKDWDFTADDNWTFACFVQPAVKLEDACLYGRTTEKRTPRGGDNYLGYQTGGDAEGLVWGAVNGGWKTGVRLHADVWQHVAVVYAAAEKKAYVFINGRERAQTYVKSVGTSSGPIRLGGEAGSGFFKGGMDEVMFFKRALQGGQAWELFAGLGGERIVRDAEREQHESDWRSKFGDRAIPWRAPRPSFGGGGRGGGKR